MVKRQIDERTLTALIDAGVVREALITRVQHQGDHKWAIQIRYGKNIQALWSKREPVRLNMAATPAPDEHRLTQRL